MSNAENKTDLLQDLISRSTTSLENLRSNSLKKPVPCQERKDVLSLLVNPSKLFPFAALLSIVLLFALSFSPYEPTRLVDLDVQGGTLNLRVAKQPLESGKNLFEILFKEKHQGMLFAFPEEKVALRSHLEQVRYPSSLAFMDKEGVILGIQDMNPHEPDQKYSAPKKARYALEVSRGWFERNKVKPGDLVRGVGNSREGSLFIDAISVSHNPGGQATSK